MPNKQREVAVFDLLHQNNVTVLNVCMHPTVFVAQSSVIEFITMLLLDYDPLMSHCLHSHHSYHRPHPTMQARSVCISLNYKVYSLILFSFICLLLNPSFHLLFAVGWMV